jgi:hypothetical protein
MRSPGLLQKHYSPRAPLTLYVGEGEAPLPAARRCGRLIRGESGVLAARGVETGQLPSGSGLVVIDLGPRQHLEIIAARLYAAMRGSITRVWT